MGRHQRNGYVIACVASNPLIEGAVPISGMMDLVIRVLECARFRVYTELPRRL